jgi:hypothetical protein
MRRAKQRGNVMKPKIVSITDPDVQVERQEIDGLNEATEALGAVATVLRYVGVQGQTGGDEAEYAASTALGLASAVELAAAQIELFQDRQLKVRGGAK